MCEIQEIRVLDLGDADSIILVLSKEGQHLIVLIDAGRPRHYKKIRSELDEVLKKYGKNGPGLLICTHYDYDHIGGIEKIVSRYALYIDEIWMHKTSIVIDIAKKLEQEEEGGNLTLAKDSEETLQLNNSGIVDYDNDDIQDILQQLKHEVETLDYLKSIGKEPKEPIAGECTFPDWPEIQVIGPTREFYQELFPQHFNLKAYLELEIAELRASKVEDVKDGQDAFELLDGFKRSPITPTNLNSAIILIETKQGKFLFPGDAGLTSFYKIPNYKAVLKDIFFLKVPHHGSANNLNSELIKLLDPEIAFIPGNHHVSPLVVTALREQGAEVYITKEENKTLIFPI